MIYVLKKDNLNRFMLKIWFDVYINSEIIKHKIANIFPLHVGYFYLHSVSGCEYFYCKNSQNGKVKAGQKLKPNQNIN